MDVRQRVARVLPGASPTGMLAVVLDDRRPLLETLSNMVLIVYGVAVLAQPEGWQAYRNELRSAWAAEQLLSSS